MPNQARKILVTGADGFLVMAVVLGSVVLYLSLNEE